MKAVRSLVWLLVIPVLFGCGLFKKNQHEGWWLAESLVSAEDSKRYDLDSKTSFMVGFHKAELQVYALSGDKLTCDGSYQPYEVRSGGDINLTSTKEGCRPMSGRMDVGGDRMTINDFRIEGKLAAKEVVLKRITYEQSLEYYGRISTSKGGGTSLTFTTPAKAQLEGFWLVKGLVYSGKTYNRGESIPGGGKAGDRDILYHFANGKVMQYTADAGVFPGYATFEIESKALVLPAQTIEGQAVAEIRYTIYNFTTDNLYVKSPSSGYDADWYKKLTDAEAIAILDANATYRRFYPR